MNPKISIVIPVYKVEKFVAECLESILSQDFDAFEVIAVDDGSPDSSGAICDDFARRDPRITVIHKENGGSAAARKTGVEHARGEWVTLVDADDILLPHALSALYAATQKFPEADIIEGSHVRFRELFDLESLPPAPKHEPLFVASGLDYARKMASVKPFTWGPWAKIIRRCALVTANAFDFPVGVLNDDTFINIRVATRARGAVKISDNIYAWRRNPNSTTHRSEFFTHESRMRTFSEIRRAVADQSAAWQYVWKTFVITMLFNQFLGRTDTAVREPSTATLLRELCASKDLAPREKQKVRMLALSNRFPLSCLPESLAAGLVKCPLRARRALKKFL